MPARVRVLLWFGVSFLVKLPAECPPDESKVPSEYEGPGPEIVPACVWLAVKVGIQEQAYERENVNREERVIHKLFQWPARGRPARSASEITSRQMPTATSSSTPASGVSD